MRNILLLAAIIGLASCAKNPEAIFDVSTTTPKLGQEVTFTNSSDNAEESIIEFGDLKSEDEFSKTVTHAYEKPGTYTATLTVYNKRDKNDEITKTITVSEPQESEIIGTWELYKIEEGFSMWFFDEMDDVTYTDDIYEFVNDTLVRINGEDDVWKLYEEGGFKLGYSSYNIVKLYNNEMILKDGESDFYELYHFKKKLTK